VSKKERVTQTLFHGRRCPEFDVALSLDSDQEKNISENYFLEMARTKDKKK